MRFPRDWLGPLDELVPFGPSAGQHPDRPERRPPAAAEGEIRRLSPLRPEDFWGEEAAAIHDALEGEPQPAPSASDLPAPPRPTKEAAKARPLRQRLARQRRPHPRADGEPRRLVLSVPRRISYRVPRRAKPRRPLATVPSAALAVAAVAIAATTLAIAALRSGPAKHVMQKAAAGAADAVATAGLPGTVSAYTPLERHRQPPPRHVVRGRVRPRGRSAPPPVTRPTFVRAVSAPAPAAPRATVTPATAQQAPPPRHIITPAPTTPVTSEPARASERMSSRRPAFGQNGLLGPGSSPNS